MLSAGFGPEIPASERPKINPLDREAIWIGMCLYVYTGTWYFSDCKTCQKFLCLL